MAPSSRPAPTRPRVYRGRFAPSPTGPLHAGSLAAALASWLDARAHGGTWLVRIEDLDPPREVPGAARDIIETLTAFGMESDEAVEYQSQRGALYEVAFTRLAQSGYVYGCACSRAEIEQALAAAGAADANATIYPGTCRTGLGGRTVRAWRFRVPAAAVSFSDRIVGQFEQRLELQVGDFVVRRADGLWAYQLAVVVDDDAQMITDVVRGADLLDNTPRQIALQGALDLAMPRYMHVGIVVNAAQHLGLPRIGAASADTFLRGATTAWAERWLGSESTL